MKKIFIGLTGASGALYGFEIIRVLEELGYETHITATNEALRNAEVENDEKYSSIEDMFRKNGVTTKYIYDISDVGAGPASGSFRIEKYIIAPASMGYIGRAANGISSNLIERCTDVALKERRDLVVLFRETPISSIHLENMLKLSNAGAVIMPAAPGFYRKPESISDLTKFVAGKVLDVLKIDNDIYARWQS